MDSCVTKRTVYDYIFRVALFRKAIPLPGKMSVLPSFIPDFFYPDRLRQLRDIFRIHPDTACNTHDLLECPCDGNLVVMNSQPIPVDNVEDSPETKAGFIFASDIRTDELDVQDKAVSNLGYQIFAFTIDQF